MLTHQSNQISNAFIYNYVLKYTLIEAFIQLGFFWTGADECITPTLGIVPLPLDQISIF